MRVVGAHAMELGHWIFLADSRRSWTFGARLNDLLCDVDRRISARGGGDSAFFLKLPNLDSAAWLPASRGVKANKSVVVS